MYFACATRGIPPQDGAIRESEDKCQYEHDADKSCTKWREDEADRRFSEEVTLDLWDESECVHGFSEVEVLRFTDRQRIFTIIGATRDDDIVSSCLYICLVFWTFPVGIIAKGLEKLCPREATPIEDREGFLSISVSDDLRRDIFLLSCSIWSEEIHIEREWRI